MDFRTPISECAPPPAVAVVLRALTVADAEAAAAVIRAAFAAQSRPTSPPSSALRETGETIAVKLAAGGGFGAFAGGHLVAVALWQADGDAVQVGRVCVVPAFRGRGLSGRLMAACEGAARGLGATRMTLRVRLALPENEKLFERLGFARLRVEAHAGFDAPTTAVMEKRLS
jgi:GNAT superfamily N-acetyltransferase